MTQPDIRFFIDHVFAHQDGLRVFGTCSGAPIVIGAHFSLVSQGGKKGLGTAHPADLSVTAIEFFNRSVEMVDFGHNAALTLKGATVLPPSHHDTLMCIEHYCAGGLKDASPLPRRTAAEDGTIQSCTCKLFVNIWMPAEVLAGRLAGWLAGQVEQKAGRLLVYAPGGVIEICNNEGQNENVSKGSPDGFLCFPWRLAIEPAPPVDASRYFALLKRLVTLWWDNGTMAVMQGNIAASLPYGGGIDRFRAPIRKGWLSTLNIEYLRLLATGQLLIRNCGVAGQGESCSMLADYLHNIPALVDEPNLRKHLYQHGVMRDSFLRWVNQQTEAGKDGSLPQLFEREWVGIESILSQWKALDESYRSA